MNIPITIIKSTLLLAIIAGISLALVNFLAVRSLWLDEASLALNIVGKGYQELLSPLDHQQVAPIGFLWIEKTFAYLFGNSDWSLRILPMISYFVAIIFMYVLSKKIIKEEVFALFAVALFSLSYHMIYYASEVKQYMSDVAITIIILYSALKFIESKNNNQYYICLLVGVFSVWFSNIAIIILFSVCLVFFYKVLEQKYVFKKVAILGCCWFISFAAYYYLFILDHPTSTYMVSYWENKNAFLPKNILSKDFLVALYLKGMRLFSLLKLSANSLILIPLLLISVFGLFKRRKDILLLLVLPVLVHLTLSYFKMYPFDIRLILYLMPILIVLIVLGIFQITNLFNEKTRNWLLCLLLMPIFFNLMILGRKDFPIERTEIKKSLSYLQKNIQDGDIVYVTYGASRAFTFYKNNYPKIYNPEKTNVLVGKYTEDWSEYKIDIQQIKKPVWILFAHIFKRGSANEKEHILELFEKEHFKIIDAQEYTGSATYKAVIRE